MRVCCSGSPSLISMCGHISLSSPPGTTYFPYWCVPCVRECLCVCVVCVCVRCVCVYHVCVYIYIYILVVCMVVVCAWLSSVRLCVYVCVWLHIAPLTIQSNVDFVL